MRTQSGVADENWKPNWLTYRATVNAERAVDVRLPKKRPGVRDGTPRHCVASHGR